MAVPIQPAKKQAGCDIAVTRTQRRCESVCFLKRLRLRRRRKVLQLGYPAEAGLDSRPEYFPLDIHHPPKSPSHFDS